MRANISVIIPVYNHEEELRECLEALEKQTLKPFEVIVVDDGSQQAISLQVSSFSFPTRLISLDKNSGAPVARNTGFKASTGELVIFLDADAVLKPEALEKLSHALETSKADFAYSGFYWGKKLFVSKAFDLELLKKENYIHTSALIRREAFPDFDESLKKFQDWDLFLTMAEDKKSGVLIEEPLFFVKPRKNGISRWLPSVAYDIPWGVLPFRPKTIQKFEHAKTIIQKKHGLSKENKEMAENIITAFLLIVIFEATSSTVVNLAVVNGIFAIIFTAILFLVTFKKPAAGFAIIITELIIGGKGELFTLMADAENNGGLSIRILFFTAFLLAWGLKTNWHTVWLQTHTWLRERREYLALAGILFWAFAYGIIKNNPFVLQDANSWGFLLLLIPTIDLANRFGKKLFTQTLAGIYAGVGYVTLKTLVLFYLFSHPVGLWLESIYYWLRKSGVGEVTRILEGASAHRIFFQSHIYEVLAIVPILFFIFFAKGKKQWWGMLFVLSFSTVLISFSRSFLIAVLLALVFFKVYLIAHKKELASWISLSKTSFKLSVASIGLVLVALFLPIPPPGNIGLTDTLLARFASDESALRSRWQLLPALWEGIRESPIIGHGFGSTVTYASLDPRVVQATGGEFTTYSFEWGWLDFWFKFGMLGIPIMLYILWSLSRRFLRIEMEHWKKMIPISMLGTLGVIHVFTPYMNHPLGIIVIILLEGTLVLESKHQLLSKKL